MKAVRCVLRYIVPFTTAEDPFPLLLSSGKWIPAAASGQTENDLYDHIRKEFLAEPDASGGVPQLNSWKQAEKKEGLCFDRAAGRGGSKDLPEFRYYPEAPKRKEDLISGFWTIRMQDLGLYLFRNGLGFVWYELAVPEGAAAEEILEFQYRIKELNHQEHAHFWYRSRKPRPLAAELRREIRQKQETRIISEYLVPFSMGEYLAEELADLAPDFLPARRNHYPGFLQRTLTALSRAEGETDFFEADAAAYPETLPDKAILFSYYALEETPGESASEDRRREMTYQAACGYKESYRMGPEIREKIRAPFANVLWFAEKEGCAYLVWPDPANRPFFSGNFPGKFRSEYFTLFIRILYQSCSLLLFGRRIREELPAAAEAYLGSAEISPQEREAQGKLYEEVTLLLGRMNLFLTKSMATAVSHIGHQNQFYLYLVQQLHVEEDAASVNAGLDALNRMQQDRLHQEDARRQAEEWAAEQARDREKQEQSEKMEAIMGLFSLLAISSAILDCCSLVNLLFPGESIYQVRPGSGAFWVYVLFLGTVLVLSGFTVWYTVPRLVRKLLPARKKGADGSGGEAGSDAVREVKGK